MNNSLKTKDKTKDKNKRQKQKTKKQLQQKHICFIIQKIQVHNFF